MAKKTQQEEKRGFVREVFGVVAFALGIFISICLYSYSPLDPSFNSAALIGSVVNYGGIVGSYLADSLIVMFGVASYLVAGFFFLISYLCFRKHPTRLHLPEVSFLFVTLIMASVLFQLKWGTLSLFGYPTMAGGLVGAVIGEQLRTYLSDMGSYLIVITLGLMAFIWATKISVLDILRVVGRLLATLGNRLSSLWTIYHARFEMWRERRAEGKKISQAVKENEEVRAVQKHELKSKASQAKVSLPNKPSVEGEEEDDRQLKIVQRSNLKSTSSPDDQLTFNTVSGEFELPSVNLLDSVPSPSVEALLDEESLKASAMLLEHKLQDYGVEGRVNEIHPGPVVTMYEFEPAAGVKVNKITNLADDLSLSMGGRPVRIVAPLPGKPAVGIEIPNHHRETVYFKEIVTSKRFQKSESKLPLALGKNIEGGPVIADLVKMPHLLVAGATGAGKSVGLNAFILSLLLRATPEEVRFIFIDPKMLELSTYANIPHLLLPVVTRPKKAAMALRWAVAEMERRYRLLSDGGVRNIYAYNKKFEKGGFAGHKPAEPAEGSGEGPIHHDQKLPYIVIVIDELADLMIVAGREVEEYITRLAQMARAAGIHMILATQRPSVDVITGVIKANFPSRISFKVTSKHDSRTILDTIGAEHLLGNGDMLFLPPGLAKQVRVHGAFVSDQEVSRVVDFLTKQAKPVFNEELLNMKEPVDGQIGDSEELDEFYDQAVAIVTETRQASISMVQRRLRIGYNRAARIIEQMEAEGIVSASMGAKGREVLVKSYANEG